jgi:hypothetical protein
LTPAVVLGLVMSGVIGVVFHPPRGWLSHQGGDSPQQANGPVPAGNQKTAGEERQSSVEPFLLRSHDDRPDRACLTLAAAVAAAGSGDTIEVHGDGPFSCEPIDIKSRALVLRAAAGHRPRLVHGRPDAPSTGFLLSSSGRLVLEGLEFHRCSQPSSLEPGGLVRTTPPGRLHVAQCRFVMDGPPTAVQAQSSFLHVRACEFLVSGDTWNALAWTPFCPADAPRAQALVHECLFFCPLSGGGAGLQLTYPRELPTYSLDLWHNSFLFSSPLSIRFGASQRDREAVVAAGKTGRVQLRANVFVGALRIIDDFAMPEWNILSASESVNLYPVVFDWHDQQNVYARGVPFLMARDQPNPLTPQRLIESLADWQKWMGGTETSSIQGDIRFTGVSGGETDLQQLRPTQFRLAAGSIGVKAGVGGRDLGADPDAVGPGTPYEAWRKTAEYQKWLKDTGQAPP